MRFIMIDCDGDTKSHLPDVTGVYATLCGLDGNDLNRNVNQKSVGKSSRVDCPVCYAIWKLCREYKSKDFLFRDGDSHN